MKRSTTWVTLLCLGLIATAAVVEAQQVSGRVINRDGAAQPGCRVELQLSDGSVAYAATTDSRGIFYLSSPRHGSYTALVRRGDLVAAVPVVVSQDGLHPSTLVVPW